MKSLYEIRLDTGKIVYVQEKSRTKAIEKYIKETGVSREWLKNHCVVKNRGREE